MSPIITSDRFTTLTDTSVTLAETGIADAVNDSGDYDPARRAMAELDFATQRREMKAIAGQPGRIHVVLVRQAVGF